MKELLITSSVLILVLTGLRFLFRGKISRRLQYALWSSGAASPAAAHLPAPIVFQRHERC